MIIDRLEHLNNYVALNPLFADVVKFLQANSLDTLQEGKHVITGDDVFLNLTTAQGRARDEAVLETHIKMIDIQIPLDGDETYGYTPLEELPASEYNTDKDISKYGSTPAQTYVTCKPGQMAVFFPQDGHAPCIAARPTIKKAIFKVKA